MAVILGTAQNATAQFQVRLEQSGFSPVTITDNGPGDNDASVGGISFSVGPYGGYTFISGAATSKPTLGNPAGSPPYSEMGSGVFTLSSSSGGTVLITVADTGFTFPDNPITLYSQVGGTLNGPAILSFQAWGNPDNLSPLAAIPTTIPAGSTGVTIGPLSSSVFSGTATTAFTRNTGPYSMFTQATVAFAGAGSMSFGMDTTMTGSPRTIHPATKLTTQNVTPGTTVYPGNPVTVTVRETNTGDSTITNVFVTGTASDCLNWSPASVASLNPGDFADFTCTFSPTATTTWTATGHGTDAMGNPVPITSDEITSGQIGVIHPATTLTTSSVTPGTTVYPGTSVTISVKEMNTGDSTITNVNVTGTGCITWTPADAPPITLPPGAFEMFSCTFSPSATTSWTATGHGTDVLNNAVPGTGETTGGTVNVVNSATTLTTLSVSPGTTVTAGTSVTITVREKNTGNFNITNVFITGTGCTTWLPASVATLTPGSTADFSCTFVVNSSTSWLATGHGTDVLGNAVPLTNETTSGDIKVVGLFCSYTPGGWGAPPNGGNIAATLYLYFSSLYPKGVVVGTRTETFSSGQFTFGSIGNYTIKLTSASAVTNYLPNGGTPGKLSQNYTNPIDTVAKEFGSQVTALQFNVDFSTAGKIKPGFNTRKVASGPLTGLTTTQVLAIANAALGGNTSVLTPYGITIPDFTSILSSVNGNYDGCTLDNGYLK